jgi:hypothetical protein
MTAVALLTVSVPSAVSTAFAVAGTCQTSQTPPAMPQPMSVSPSRIDRGSGWRRAQPTRAAPCR